jgi:integrase
VTFAEAAEAWLSHAERTRALNRSTLADYRHMLDAYLLPARPDATRPDAVYGRAPFATKPVGDLRSTELKEWYENLPSGRTADKLLTMVRAILRHARSHDAADTRSGAAVERMEVRFSNDDDVYSVAEIDSLVGAAANEQDAAIFLTAARTGLRRRELVGLRWRDIDFSAQTIRVPANFSDGELVTPKRGKVGNVPMLPEIAQALARLRQREAFTSDGDPVFADTVGEHLEANAVRRRYARAAKRAGLRPLPFQSLRHTSAP